MKTKTKPFIQKFYVNVNPFTQEITLWQKNKHKFTFQYDSLDEWNGIEYDGKEYDVHILYEHELSVSIYDVVNKKGTVVTETGYWHDVVLKIKTKD